LRVRPFTLCRYFYLDGSIYCIKRPSKPSLQQLSIDQARQFRLPMVSTSRPGDGVPQIDGWQ
jgi:hypothetical protein